MRIISAGPCAGWPGVTEVCSDKGTWTVHRAADGSVAYGRRHNPSETYLHADEIPAEVLAACVGFRKRVPGNPRSDDVRRAA